MCQGCFDKVIYIFFKRKNRRCFEIMEVIKGRKKYWNIFLNWKKALVSINENTQKILLNFLKQLK